MDVLVPSHRKGILADGRDHGDQGGPIQHGSDLYVFELVLIEHGSEYGCELANSS